MAEEEEEEEEVGKEEEIPLQWLLWCFMSACMYVFLFVFDGANGEKKL